ncbi:MAG: replication-associated recombination protein A, partial [Myxococcota bacterium]|nr:replication-associated recombination protein A [Myxococcota bacterium]
PHNYSGHQVDEHYLPETLQGVSFYQPSDQGEEKVLLEKLNESKSKT